MDLREVTVVILSRGRETELSKTLAFWSTINISVLVLHNTEKPIQSMINMPNVEYVVAKIPYGERCGLVERYLKTDYAILCSDDEVYIPSALANMKALLEQELELMSVGGLTVSVGKYGPITTGNFSYSKIRGYENKGEYPLSRIINHFDMKSGYRNGAIYRLMRKDLFISTMNLFSLLTNISTPYIYEVTGEIFVNSQGMTKYTEDVYWLRNWINDPVGHKNWDRKMYFKDWAAQNESREQFSTWKRTMQNAMALSDTDFENALSGIIQLRADSERHEMSNNLRRRLSIPAYIKWFIRLCFKPSSLPHSLDKTLDTLENSGAIVDRIAINQGLTALS